MTGMDIGVALGGTIFVENVFGLNGLGRTMTRAVQTYDLPIVLGVLLFMTVAIVVFNLIVDIAYALIDPRVRAGRTVETEGVARAPMQRTRSAVAEGTTG